jgi:hypothetical protein
VGAGGVSMNSKESSEGVFLMSVMLKGNRYVNCSFGASDRGGGKGKERRR